MRGQGRENSILTSESQDKMNALIIGQIKENKMTMIRTQQQHHQPTVQPQQRPVDNLRVFTPKHCEIII